MARNILMAQGPTTRFVDLKCPEKFKETTSAIHWSEEICNLKDTNFKTLNNIPVSAKAFF